MRHTGSRLGKLCVFTCLGSALVALAPSCAGGGDSPEGSAGGGSGGGSGGNGGLNIDAGATGGGGNGGTGGAPQIEEVPPAGPYWQYSGTAVPDGTKAYKDDSLPDDVATQFGGSTTTSGAPSLVYPLAGAMFARNQSGVVFQWNQGATTNRVFKIEVTNTANGETLWFFAPCATAQCTYAMPENEWLYLAWYNANSSVTVRIHGTDGQGGAVATSPDTTLYFSPTGIIGALYYWAANLGEIKRATFGADLAVPFIVRNSATNDFDCASCHSVSRNGETIAFAVAPPSTPANPTEDYAAIRIAPTQDPTQPYVRPAGAPGNPTTFMGHNVALSPNGLLAAVNGMDDYANDWPPYFEIRDARTGATLGRWNVGDPIFGTAGGTELYPIHPEWSPDGTKIAVALIDGSLDGTCTDAVMSGLDDPADWGCTWTSQTCRSGIAIIPYLGNGQIGTPAIVVQQTGMDYHFYPTWSPDGEWIAFASARLDQVCSQQQSESNPNAVLRMARATGGPYTCPSDDCIELTNGTQYTWDTALAGQGKQSTWPKFAPFAQGENGNIFFIGFNTKIDYGFLSPIDDTTHLNENEIWMFAVDVSKVGTGDPSYAPVWLPYQDLYDGSITPYWTSILPCQSDPSGGCTGCVAGEECIVDSTSNVCRCESNIIQ
jgi:hypothetical protein